MRLNVEVGAEIGDHAGHQVLLRAFGIVEGFAREGILFVQNLAADDFVNPAFVDLQPAQFVGDLDGVAADAEIGRRALQHGDVGAIVSDVGHQRRGGGAGADHDHPLVPVVEVFRPVLRMDDAALERRHLRPVRRIALGMAVVTLAHPEETGGETQLLSGVGALGDDGPKVVRIRPVRRKDAMAVADMGVETVFGDHFGHIRFDFRRGGDRRTGPRLEAIAEGVEIAVGADAGVAMRAPGAAEAILRFQRHEAGARALFGQVIGGADAGDSGADDHHVEVFGRSWGGLRDLALNVHSEDSLSRHRNK